MAGTRQGELFGRPTLGPPPPRATPAPLADERAPIAARAGTVLDHDHTIALYARRPLGGVPALAGYVDRRHRVYQGGGELRNFLFRQRYWISLQGDVWTQLLERHVADVEAIEMIDHPQNRCFRITLADARAFGAWYDAGIGRRWGVPFERWAIIPFTGPPGPLIGG